MRRPLFLCALLVALTTVPMPSPGAMARTSADRLTVFEFYAYG